MLPLRSDGYRFGQIASPRQSSGRTQKFGVRIDDNLIVQMRLWRWRGLGIACLRPGNG